MIYRITDLTLAVAALILLAPFFIVIAVVLKFTGEGEIFYFQVRKGKNRHDFRVLKFATMLKNSPNMGSGTITSKNDPRILPVGRILRKTKLNELPQLINVVLGEMSLIGPRPHVEIALRGIEPDVLKNILTMAPGLSGLGSLVFRHEEQILQTFEDPRKFYDTIIAPYKARLEVWYLENRSYRLYWRLIYLTLYLIVTNDKRPLRRLYQRLPAMPPELEQYLNL